jgi:hypothetical protein
MRTRFIKPGKRNRMVIRGPFTDDTITISKYILSSGYKAATIVQFWLHVVFWNRKPRLQKKRNVVPSAGGSRKTEAKGEGK